MRVAVTGASGFVGRHAVRALRARGADVVALSRHPQPADDPAVLPVVFDITRAGADAFERIGRPDALLHLAWGGLPDYRAATHLEHELPCHARFLEHCVRGGLAQLVVAGTCLEYGMQEGELDESMVAAPIVAYARAKEALRQRAAALSDELGFGLGWIRLFYLFGDGQSPTSLYQQLRAAVASGAPRFRMSPGDQIRDFLSIETAAAKLATLVMGHPDAGIVNLCSGRPVAVADAVRGWLREWGANLDLDLGALPYPDYEPFAFWGSTRRLDALPGTP